MAENVGSIEYDSRINTADFKKGAKEIDASAKNVGKEVSDSMEKTESAVHKAGKVVAVGLAAVGAGLTAVAKNATDFTKDYVSDVRKISRETGTSVEETSKLLYAFKRMGLETEEASASFGLFSKKIVESTQKTGEHKAEVDKLNLEIEKTQHELNKTNDEIKKNGDKSGDLALKVKDLNSNMGELQTKLKETVSPFEKLGISTLDNTGKQKAFSAILLETADRFKVMPDGVDKTALALELFGKKGKDLLPILNKGSEGILELEKQADKLGLTLKADTIDKIAKLVQSQKNLKDSTDSMKIAIGTLTAPVLTAFNQKLNEAVLKLVAAESPFRAVTTTVLAFGGPISLAAAGLIEFASNLGGAIAIAKTFATVLTGPVGIALGAIAVVVGIVTTAFVTHKQSIDRTKLAADELKASYDTLKTAQDTLHTSQLTLEGSQLSVERAQNNYNYAVKQFGPNSLEAREALHSLKTAQEDLKAAQDKTKQSQAELEKAQSDYSKKKEFSDKIKDDTEAVRILSNTFQVVAKTINGTVLQPQTIQQKGDPLNVLGKLGRNAQGTNFWRGGATWVGENGPEIVNLPRGSQVIPNDEIGMGSIVNNIGTINVSSEVDADNLIRRITQDQEIIGKGLTPQQRYA